METSEPADIFHQMGTVLMIDRALECSRARRERGDPALLNECDVLEFATGEGAWAIGLEHKVGRLAPGMKADLILIDLDRINVFPVNDVVGTIVLGADTSNVRWVFVEGQARKRDEELVGVDIERVRRLALESRDYVCRQAKRAPITPPSQCSCGCSQSLLA